MDKISVSKYLTGGLSFQFIAVAFIFLTLSFLTSKVIQFMLRDSMGERTPQKLSFTFWIKDNKFSIVVFALTCFPLVVFTEDFVSWIGLKIFNVKNQMFVYYFLGLAFSSVMEKILKKLELVRSLNS
jgi:hypothetical protein